VFWWRGLRYWGTVAAFVGPFLCFLVLFQYVPVATMLRDSLEDYSLLNPSARAFIGLRNYVDLLSDPTHQQAFLTTLVFAAGVVLVVVPLSFLIAVYLNGRLPARPLVRAVVFLPVITSTVVVATMWTFLLDPDNGLVNNTLSSLGVAKQAFLTSASQALPSLVAVTAWQQVGFATILYLSGLQGIPMELIEAATVDGASAWQRFRWMTIPLLGRTTVFVVVIVSVFALQAFAPSLIMTSGGPEGTTNFVVFDIYQTAFSMQQPGMASAISVLFMLIVMLISLVQMALLRTKWNY
jgi:ABC-type sugar transport system permease subunit